MRICDLDWLLLKYYFIQNINLFFIVGCLSNLKFIKRETLKKLSRKVLLAQKKRIVICGGEAVRWALGFKGFLFSWFKGGGPLVF
jgi:hypothetical protein